MYAGLFESLGASVVSLERTDEFVPIDTEAVAESDKEKARAWSKKHELDFIFSTDGDGDRPLVADEDGEWLRGDILGLLCAREMEIDAIAIPVSCNSAIESTASFERVLKTKIGSPYVIAEFDSLAENYKRIAGFEANGGFLLGSDVDINNQLLRALPTRDAVLPALMLLSAARNKPITELVKELPSRHTHSDRIQNFERGKSVAIVERGSTNPKQLIDSVLDESKEVLSTDTTDGLRITLTDNTIVHLRPSGNAPELRCYAEANDFSVAKGLVDKVLTAVQKL
ncbi:phosphomannomutase [Vibrio ishigakensis]|uniref:Phosphomannomutase n=1 Tax=Vibrio ishigakensis TaxID=1481914 RepID=A0A0B8P921_9VIBR|nr:phosphomannomutase [Vibrio ishigakensis]